MEQQIRLTEQEARLVLAWLYDQRQCGDGHDERITEGLGKLGTMLECLLYLDFSEYEDGAVAVVDVSIMAWEMLGNRKRKSPAKIARL